MGRKRKFEDPKEGEKIRQKRYRENKLAKQTPAERERQREKNRENQQRRRERIKQQKKLNAANILSNGVEQQQQQQQQAGPVASPTPHEVRQFSPASKLVRRRRKTLERVKKFQAKRRRQDGDTVAAQIPFDLPRPIEALQHAERDGGASTSAAVE